MRKPKLGETMIVYLRDEKVIGMPTLCVPLIVTDAAEVQTDAGKTIIICGGLAIIGPAAQYELQRAGATMPAMTMIAPCMVAHNLPRNVIPKSTTCTWPAIHESVFPDQFVLRPTVPAPSLITGTEPLDLGEAGEPSDPGDTAH